MKLLFASSNEHKIAEIKAILPNGIQLISLKEIHFYDEIPETADTIEGNAIQKATFLAEKMNIPCFADDTLPGASLNGLNGTWSPGVINNQVSQNYTFTPAGSECAADDYVMSIVINPLPDVTMNELPPCTSDQPFQLTGGLPVNGGYFGEGIVGGYFLPDSAGFGTHTITYVYTNLFGCSSSASTAFNADNCLGLNEMEYSDLSIYPNPSSGKITIELEASPILNYSLIDLTGKCLMTGTKNGNKIEIDLAAFPNGYYVIELTTASSTYRNSIVIQN